jgi:hypothetical protein
MQDLVGLVHSSYLRQLKRARKEWPMLPHPEFADERFNEIKMIYEGVARVEAVERERLLADIRANGT